MMSFSVMCCEESVVESQRKRTYHDGGWLTLGSTNRKSNVAKKLESKVDFDPEMTFDCK